MMLRSVQRRLRVVTFFFPFLQLLTAQTFNDSGFSAQQFVTLPAYRAVGLQFAPDGRVFVWQKDGIISLMKNGALVSTPVLDIRSQVNAAADRGMIGFVLDPSFASNGYFYVAYVYEDPATTGTLDQFAPHTQRVSRFRMDPASPDVDLKNSETVILERSRPPVAAVSIKTACRAALYSCRA